MKKIVVILLVWFLLIGVIGMALDSGDIKYEDTEVYVVEQGDTLWDIASDIGDDEYNINSIVYEIRKLNDDEVVVNEGQELIVPVLD